MSCDGRSRRGVKGNTFRGASSSKPVRRDATWIFLQRKAGGAPAQEHEPCPPATLRERRAW